MVMKSKIAQIENEAEGDKTEESTCLNELPIQRKSRVNLYLD